MKKPQFYLKGMLDGKHILTPFTGIVYTTCEKCGAEMNFNILTITRLYHEHFGTVENPLEANWICDECSEGSNDT